jgi:hypothetical protein
MACLHDWRKYYLQQSPYHPPHLQKEKRRGTVAPPAVTASPSSVCGNCPLIPFPRGFSLISSTQPFASLTSFLCQSCPLPLPILPTAPLPPPFLSLRRPLGLVQAASSSRVRRALVAGAPRARQRHLGAAAVAAPSPCRLSISGCRRTSSVTAVSTPSSHWLSISLSVGLPLSYSLPQRTSSALSGDIPR